MYVNPSSGTVQVTLSDGSVHQVRRWKYLQLPNPDEGEPLRVVQVVAVTEVKPADAA